MKLQPKDNFMIVIGASAGGMSAIGRILSGLDKDLPAVIAIVIHLPQNEDSEMFVSRLQGQTDLPCRSAKDGLLLQRGHVYFAPSGHHMNIKKDRIVLSNGPAEGRWRPSIDATMRSAAVAWNSRCIGIILTGMLDDGTVGMEAIQRCGGFTMIQDPAEADYPNMPLSVTRNITVDWCGRLQQLAKALTKQLKKKPPEASVPEEIRKESAIVERTVTELDNLPELGDHSLFSCPACGGGLWEIKHGSVARYRCHIGHGYTETELLQGQELEIEKTLWIALKTMEEKRKLLEKIAIKEAEQGLDTLARDHRKRSEEMSAHIERLKELIFREREQHTKTG